MSLLIDCDECSECGASLPAEDPQREGAQRIPCPNCGSTKRTKYASCSIQAGVSMKVDTKLIIGWHEVDRLVEAGEYAAAILVAAVNLEFVLCENLRRVQKSVTERSLPRKVRRTWRNVEKNGWEALTLGRILCLTEALTKIRKLKLSPSWDPLVSDINEVRCRIAHDRGYFSRLTQLRDQDWPEMRIREILNSAKAFCHGNAP